MPNGGIAIVSYASLVIGRSGDLNSKESASLGVEHDAEGGADGSGGESFAESGQNCTGVAVAGGDLAPDGLNDKGCTLNLLSDLPVLVLYT